MRRNPFEGNKLVGKSLSPSPEFEGESLGPSPGFKSESFVPSPKELERRVSPFACDQKGAFKKYS